jgi:hypothetical protein
MANASQDIIGAWNAHQEATPDVTTPSKNMTITFFEDGTCTWYFAPDNYQNSPTTLNCTYAFAGDRIMKRVWNGKTQIFNVEWKSRNEVVLTFSNNPNVIYVLTR